MTFPTEQQLRQWWKQEMEFNDSRLGRAFNAMKYEFLRCEKELEHYKRMVVSYAETQIIPPTIKVGTPAEQTDCDSAKSTG